MEEQQTELPPHRVRRISLTKTQLQTEVGAELLSLCQTVTADGKLAAEEVDALRQWVDDGEHAALPAASYLREVVARVIADGQITPEEYREVYRAVESVLPVEVRRIAKAARKAVERQKAARNAPIESANFMVAGCRYEGRPIVIERHARAGDSVLLVRDPRNRYSRNAIAVRLTNGQQVGFVPEVNAVDLAGIMDGGAKYEAYMTKILTGGRSPIPVVQAHFYNRDSDRGAAAKSAAPEPPTRARLPMWVIWLIIALAGIIIWGLFRADLIS